MMDSIGIALNMKLQIGGLEKLEGSEFLWNGYITLGEIQGITIGDCVCSIQYFQGRHEDEYTVRKGNKVCLF